MVREGDLVQKNSRPVADAGAICDQDGEDEGVGRTTTVAWVVVMVSRPSP